MAKAKLYNNLPLAVRLQMFELATVGLNSQRRMLQRELTELDELEVTIKRERDSARAVVAGHMTTDLNAMATKSRKKLHWTQRPENATKVANMHLRAAITRRKNNKKAKR